MKLEDVPVPAWHLEVIEERMKAYRANPSEGKPWVEVRQELLEKLRRRRADRANR
jgi:hypothetical protein